jgi:hypothetical protein
MARQDRTVDPTVEDDPCLTPRRRWRERSGPWLRPCVPGGGAPAPTTIAPESRLLRRNELLQPAGKPAAGVW